MNQQKPPAYDLAVEGRKALDKYNGLYNNNLYQKVEAETGLMSPEQKNSFMNHVIDSALELCGMTFYAGTTLKTIAEALTGGHFLAQATINFLIPFNPSYEG